MIKKLGSVVGGRGTEFVSFPRFPPFTLGIMADGSGARIYKGRFLHAVTVINFEKKYIETDSGTEEINSLYTQEPIPKLQVEKPELMGGGSGGSGGSGESGGEGGEGGSEGEEGGGRQCIKQLV